MLISRISNREAYCLMKMAEKGIKGNVEDLRKSANLPSSGKTKHKFNAFKESAKSSNDADKSAKEPKPLEFTYAGENIKMNADGSVDDENVKFPKNSVLLVSGVGEGSRAFGELKVCIAILFITIICYRRRHCMSHRLLHLP